MAKVRSPNYPVVSLTKAIELAGRIYQKEHTHKAGAEVVAKAMGYSGLNGASMGMLSALKKYGLLEEVGKDLKISSDALTILVDPKDSAERVAAIRKAAFLPVLFLEFRNQYGDTLPSDENLRSFLLKREFSPNTVDGPIRSYRETIALVNDLPKADNGEDVPTNEEEEMGQQGSVVAPIHGTKALEAPKAAPSAPPTGKQVGSAIPVTKNCSMSIIADGEVTQEGLDRLVQYIGLIKSSFPETDSTIQ
jgi:hypothetical protein